jgi:hypothetical protein
MADRTVQLWECDRCLAEAWGDEIDFQPKEWIGVRITTPPKAAGPEAAVTLCGRCASLLNKWLLPPEKRPYKPGPHTPASSELAAAIAEAKAQGRTPRELIRERYGVSEATANRYIRRAKEWAVDG